MGHRGALAVLVATALSLRAGAPCYALEPEQPDQQAFISRAAFAEGRLWLLSDAGDLSSLADGDVARRREILPKPVFDLCVQNGDPVVILADRAGAGEWTLSRHRADHWIPVRRLPASNDVPRSLACDAQKMVLLTSRRLIELSADGKLVRQVNLVEGGKAGLSGRGVVTGAVRAADGIYVGLDAGEWGGGLRRIDPETGQIANIERVDAGGGICGGPLIAACDPVNGLGLEPGKPDCLVATIGLEHFFSEGRLLEVCGTQVKVLFSKPLQGSNSSTESVAFFGLASAPGALIAAGNDGLYRIGAGGDVKYSQLPMFHSVDGVSLSFDLPDVVLVLTEVNQRDSVSGAVPLVISR